MKYTAKNYYITKGTRNPEASCGEKLSVDRIKLMEYSFPSAGIEIKWNKMEIQCLGFWATK